VEVPAERCRNCTKRTNENRRGQSQSHDDSERTTPASHAPALYRGLGRLAVREGSIVYAELDRNLKREYRAAYTSDIANVARARRAIAGFAAQCGFLEDEVSDIRLAAGEALSNAVEHGRETPARQIMVRCVFRHDQLTIEIQDNGSAFTEPSDRPSVEPDDRGRGFGIFLMRRLMDEVAFARNGRLVRLVRRRAWPR
jgi:anti-sigma regulatory factor (Ser/Thr protein kinase)